jgi:23S rRNA (cytosine1962-C5)-methyltransferase
MTLNAPEARELRQPTFRDRAMGRMNDLPSPPPTPPRPPVSVSGQGNVPNIHVSNELKGSLAKGHPWIYRDHLPRGTEFAPGTWVRVHCDGWMGIGIFDPASPLSIRIYTRGQVPDAEWFRERVQRAYQRRAPLHQDGLTSAYRLINGEGDGMPGIVVDVYGQFAALRLDTSALAGLMPWVVEAVQAAIDIKGICQKTKQGIEILSGRPPPDRLIVSEHGLRFFADLGTGQKTGLFLDHRENRQSVEGWCTGARVLNLFSYTGGFSLYAARGGASEVVSVDRAGEAMQRARDNVELNGMSPDHFEFVAADAFKYLEQLVQQQRKFDVVISDPPTFARNRMQRRRALQTYERLHTLSLGVLAEGGLYAAASCTSQIDVDTFRGSIAQAASQTGHSLQIVMETGQALDHPVMVGHPEGRYLKFVALRSVGD